MYRACRAVIRLVARIVPAPERQAWRQEWAAELQERWQRLAARNELDRRHQMNMLRRILGSFFDAAWLRRQFTRDAELIQDLRHGIRVLRRSPGFAITAVLVLALGIGATVGIFSVVDTLLLRTLPYAEGDRTVVIWQGQANNPDVRDDVAPANCMDWREHLRLFDIVSCVQPWAFDFTGGPEPEVLHAAAVTEGFFRAFGVEPMIGRLFAPEEFLKERNRVIVINHGMWQQKLGGDPNIVGRTINLDGTGYVVLGVLPPTFRPRLLQGSGDRGIYFPYVVQGWERTARGSNYWNVVARLKPGITFAQGQAELDALSRRLAEEYPRTNATVVARAQPLRDHLAGNLRPALRLLLAAVGLLLLMAAANVANLLLARAAARTRELAVRSAIGAGRARLVRQLLAESLLLAALGSMAGLLVAWWTVRAIVALAPTTIPSLATVTIDARVIAFAVALTGFVAIAVGLVPAWQSSGGRRLDVMRGISPSSGGTGRQPLRVSIVVAEVALALLLMTGAGLLLRSFSVLLQTDPGFNPERVVALQVFAWDRNTTPEKRALFMQQVLDRMRSRPQVQEVGAVLAMPFIEANINMEAVIAVEGRPTADGEGTGAFLSIATPGYFEAMRIPRREGRVFESSDTAHSTPVAVVSEALAKRIWPGTSAIGQKIRYTWNGRTKPAEIVGVVSDVRHDGLDRPARLELFVPHNQMPYGSMTFVARTHGDPAAVIQDLKAQIYTVDPLQAIYRAATAQELVSKSLVERRFMLALLTGFALLAGALAAIGIYGVISVATTQRTREFGVRLALGAHEREILQMVLKQGAAMIGIGLVIGMAGALVFGRVMSGFLYGITPADPVTLSGVMALLAVVAFAACVLPAHRATRVDPLVALRVE
jgi:putative ABC transport system permease protein